MTRPIITDTQGPQSPAPQAQAQQPQQAAPVQPPVPKDTLAGAFPAWDLVPTTTFIRRVK